MSLFDINHIACEVIGYPISYVELIGTLFGLVSVYFASRANILTWPLGIVNELFLFILFFQVQLYADMFLQVYFFIVTLWGWYNWRQKPSGKDITVLKLPSRLWLVFLIVLGTIFTGLFFSRIHLFFPAYFPIEAAYPFADSLVMVLSILATVLLAQKKIESWVLWILVDVVCVFLFFEKGIVFLGLEYLIFLGIASYGLLHWYKQMKHV